MLNKSCKGFIKDLSSNEPVPGGGGTCAYLGALGMALGSMVGNLTLGKKKYKEFEKDIEKLLILSDGIIYDFEKLVQKDADSFIPLAKAYKLPKNTEEEKLKKEEALQIALVDATIVPLEIARLCLKAIDLHEEYAKKGTKMAISDVGVGVVFCKAAFQGAKLNVLINTKIMKNQELRSLIEKELEIIEAEVIEKADRLYADVEMELSGR